MKRFTEYSNEELDETYESVESPDEFKNGLVLKEHQKTVVAALLDIESNPVIETEINRSLSIHPTIVRSEAIVLSEPFGSGKTYEILALMIISPIPPAFPQQVKLYNPSHHGFYHQIFRRFIGPKAFIRPNLIIVGHAVLDQWVHAVAHFTHLRLMRIGDHKAMKEFKQAYDDGSINGYDIVILKNGKVTGSFAREGGTPESLITVVGNITAKSCWSRVVYDDYDTIAIPAKTITVNALSTIYVSATKRGASSVRKVDAPVAENILGALHNQRAALWYAQHDEKLFTLFNVRNSQGFVDSCALVTRVNFLRAVYKNTNNDLIRAIGAMGGQTAPEIMQMLNGDAIETAAQIMGIVSLSIADIFEKMLDKKYKAFINGKRIMSTVIGLAPLVKTKPFGDVDHKDICERIVAGQPISTENLHNSNEFLKALGVLYVRYKEIVEISGREIERVISNVKEGMCQICCSPLKERTVFIVKCCGNILCRECCVRGCSLVERGRNITGTCATCKRPINSMQGLIFVDKTINIENLLTAIGNETAATPGRPAATADPTPEPEPVPELMNPKIQALIDIIEGRTPEGEVPHEVYIPKLINGTIDVPAVNERVRKVLVFASHNETIGNIEEALHKQNIAYERLNGTFREMTRTLARFREYGRVLIVNSSHYCAGVNIEFCTDLVFFHKLIHVGIEAQVIGRAQRIGRTTNLNVHYLMYENETNVVAN